MENPTLAEGSSFGDIAVSDPVPADALEATPEASKDADAATDGGTPPEGEEVPGVLKEDEPEESGDEKPDLNEVDADFQAYLDKHPEFKRRWEAEIARKDKGIDKWMSKQAEKFKDYDELKGFHEDYHQAKEFLDALDDPNSWERAYKDLGERLGKHYGTSVTQATPESDAEGSKYGFEFPSEDRILEKSVEVMEDRLARLLDQRLGPIAKKFESEEQAAKITSEATAAVPALKSRYEVSAEPWVTSEKVAEAMREFPGLTPDKAFRAHFADEIARYTVKHTSRKEVRPLPTGQMAGRTHSDLKTGASFLEIAEAEAVSIP